METMFFTEKQTMSLFCKACSGWHLQVSERDKCVLDRKDSIKFEGVDLIRRNGVFKCAGDNCDFFTVSGSEMCDHFKDAHLFAMPSTMDVLASLMDSNSSQGSAVLEVESHPQEEPVMSVVNIDEIDSTNAIEKISRCYGFNARNKVFICLLCQSALKNLSSLCKHISNCNLSKKLTESSDVFHTQFNELYQIEQDRLKELDEDCKPMLFKLKGTFRFEKVQGIEVRHNYIFCDTCEKAFGSKSYYEKHHTETCIVVPSMVSVQSLFRRPVKYFPLFQAPIESDPVVKEIKR